VPGVRSRTALASGAISVVGGVALALMAVYAAMHPQPLPDDQVDAWLVMAANQGAVQWPAILAVLSFVAAIAVLWRPGRLTYLLTGALGAVMVGIALTLPDWLATLAPLAVLLGLTGVAAVIVAIVGWVPSEPLPESLPGWPEHHGGI
jgi:hypothetical protein